ncbi:MAG: hypothetical protein A2091_03195 [Desulfuromonadales bacterium GWD2_61_12]|nr:MAG: hypothetical protein A2091_03195 [Desulfuromonadales bacterium GWD2_61_12]
MCFAPAAVSSPLILVADDEHLVRTIHVDLLKQAGFRTATAASRAEVLACLEEMEPDLLLLDLLLPGTDGVGICQALRGHPRGGAMPILMVTSAEDSTSIHRAFEAGVTDFVTKPVQPELFVHRVRFMLRAADTLKRLRRSEETLAKAQRNARLGCWEWDLPSGQMWLSAEICGFLGYAEEPLRCPLADFLASVHPRDVPPLQKIFTAPVAAGQVLALEYRCLSRSGQEAIVYTQGEAVCDSFGRVRGLSGTMQEMTEHKRTETRLRLLKEAVEALPVGITITDRSGRIIYCNPAEAMIHGFGAEEMLDREARLFAPSRLQKKAVPKHLERAPLWRRESVNRRKGGEEFPVQLASLAVHDADGEFLGLVTTCEDISERKRAEERIHQLAYYDNLTGLPNRWMFRDRLDQALALARRTSREVALLFLDLDRFKLINDTMGHDFGDRLLSAVAERLAVCMRKADTVARLGGDEFVVVLTQMEGYAGATVAAQRIVDEFLQPFELQGRTLYSPPSIGIAIFPMDGDTVDDLIRNADTALYHAKALGGSIYCFFTQEMNLRAVEKIVLETELRQALEAEQFTLYYQPQVNLESGRVVALEALMRWQHPVHGVILPGEFISILEDTGLILRLGEWLLREACAQIGHGQKILPGLEMAVNISSRQFQQPGFLEMVDKVLREAGVAPGLLTLELTESIIMDEPEKSRQLLQQLRERGLGIAIDDFGTGYSSLGYLKNFPIDQLKIDRSFVHEVLTNPDDAGIVEAITVIARRLNLDVVAEGIESREQAEFLSSCGCQAGQGYYFAKPLPPELLWAQLGEGHAVAIPPRVEKKRKRA